MLERILVSRERAGLSIDSQGLVALAWAVVGHAGHARRRRRDFVAREPGRLRRRSAAFVRSCLKRSWGTKGRYEQQRCQKVFNRHPSVPHGGRLIAKTGWSQLPKSGHRAACECQLENNN